MLINLAKRDDLSNIDIIKEIDPFLNTEIGTKVLYLISILNKCKFPRILLLLYLGFIIGEKIEFIKKNYTLNLMDLLRTVKSGISFIDSKMQIYSLSENSLEILNLYVFSKVFLGDEKNYIYSLENALINSDYNEKMIKIYYHKLEKDKLLDYIFYGKENNLSNEIYKNKSSLLIQDIKVKIKELKDLSKDQLDLELSKNAKFPEDYHEEIKFEIKDEKIDNYHDKNELHPFIQRNINSSNNKSLINEIDLTKNNNQVDIKTSIKSPVDKNENKIKEEEGVQSHLKKKKDSIDELSDKDMSLINNSININDGFEGSDSKGKNNISFINNSKASTTKENSGEKKENLDISIYSITSNFEDNFFTQINNYVNYPKIEELNIPIDESDKKKEKYLPMRINSFLTKLDIITEKLDNILKSSIFDMIEHSTNIKNNAKFKLFTISILRLEILINLLKNANIINIKRKLIEVLIYHLYLENKDYFKLGDDYIPSDKNIKDLESIIRAKLEKK